MTDTSCCSCSSYGLQSPVAHKKSWGVMHLFLVVNWWDQIPVTHPDNIVSFRPQTSISVLLKKRRDCYMLKNISSLFSSGRGFLCLFFFLKKCRCLESLQWFHGTRISAGWRKGAEMQIRFLFFNYFIL